jgi:hypothetical protein
MLVVKKKKKNWAIQRAVMIFKYGGASTLMLVATKKRQKNWAKFDTL